MLQMKEQRLRGVQEFGQGHALAEGEPGLES